MDMVAIEQASVFRSGTVTNRDEVSAGLDR